MSNPLPQPTASTDEAARRRAASLIGRVISQRYRIDEVVAMGGMGAVYRGEHVRMRKRVAIKILHPDTEGLPELVTRFEREAVAGAHIQHPNVATATDFGETEDGLFYLILEYVRGITLHELIRRGPMPASRAVHIARQLAAGLQAAHDMEVVHRDVKPRNVMVIEAQGDLVKLIDFGFAKVELKRLSAVAAQAGRDDVGAEPERLTGAGVVFGTVAYLAPEAAFGMEAVDARSDLYALGLMFYELLAGKHPFTATDPVALFTQQCTLMPPPIAERAPGVQVPPEIEAVVQRLCAKRQDARYQSAAEMIDALDEACVAAGLALPSPVSASTRPPPTTSARTPSLPPPPAVPKLEVEPAPDSTPAPAPPQVAPVPEALSAREAKAAALETATAKPERAPVDQERGPIPEERGAIPEERPTVIREEPALILEERATVIREERALIQEERALIQEERGAIGEERALIQEERGPIPEERGVIGEERALIQEERALIQEERALIQEERAPNQEERALIQEERALIQEERALIQEERAPNQEERALIQEERGAIQEERGAIQEERGAIQEERALGAEERGPIPEERGPIPEERALGAEERALDPETTAVEAAETEAEPTERAPKRKRKRSERKEKRAERAAREAEQAAEAAEPPPPSERASEPQVSRPALAPAPLPAKKAQGKAAKASAPRRGLGTYLAIAAVVAGVAFLFANRSSAPPEPGPPPPRAAPAPAPLAAAPPSADPAGEIAPASTASSAPEAPPDPSAAPSAEPAAAPAAGPDAKNRELLSVAMKRRKWSLATDALLALAASDPAALEDKQLAAAARELAASIAAGGKEARADQVFEAIGSKFGSAGPDVLYKLVEGRGRSAPALHAADLLRTPEVAARATPATRIAFELRDAPCDKKLTLLDRAVEDGDARALLVLDTIVKACFKQSRQVDEASKKLKDRLQDK